MFTLAISYLTSSNLPWFMDLTFQVPMQYCSLQHRILRPSHPVTSTAGCCFSLAPSLHSFWSYFSTLLQEHIGHLPTQGVHLSVSYFLPFHTVHGVLKARILKWFSIPFSSGSRFVRTLHILSELSIRVCQNSSLILWISELKWTGIGEFNSDDHYVY